MGKNETKGKSMLRTSLLILSLIFLSACGFMHNAHPYNAIAPEAAEIRSIYGISSTGGILRAGTYSPDSLNTDIHNRDLESRLFRSVPQSIRLGLGKGFSAGYDFSMVSSTDLHPSGFDQMFSPTVTCTALKLHLAKSLDLGRDYHVSLSPAIYISQGVDALSTRRHRMKYRHKGVELPLTLSKEIHKPMNLVLSGTLRGAEDTFRGDISYPSPFAFHYYDFWDQPENKVNRYAAMVHADIRLSSELELVTQYGREYVRGKDRSLQHPILYLGVRISNKSLQILKPFISE